jgi:hypothetical protein
LKNQPRDERGDLISATYKGAAPLYSSVAVKDLSLTLPAGQTIGENIRNPADLSLSTINIYAGLGQSKYPQQLSFYAPS